MTKHYRPLRTRGELHSWCASLLPLALQRELELVETDFCTSASSQCEDVFLLDGDWKVLEPTGNANASLGDRYTPTPPSVHSCPSLTTASTPCAQHEAPPASQRNDAAEPSGVACVSVDWLSRRLDALEGMGRPIPGLLIDQLALHAVCLAPSPRGCLQLMRAYECSEQAVQERLVCSLLPRLGTFAYDKNAHHLVQCVVQRSRLSLVHRYVLDHFVGHLCELSLDVHASRVVEAIVRRCGAEVTVMRHLMHELIYATHALRRLIHSRHGSVVLQSLASALHSQEEVTCAFRVMDSAMQSSPYWPCVRDHLVDRRHQLFQDSRQGREAEVAQRTADAIRRQWPMPQPPPASSSAGVAHPSQAGRAWEDVKVVFPPVPASPARAPAFVPRHWRHPNSTPFRATRVRAPGRGKRVPPAK